jgi:hypothetical protein
MYFLIYPIGFPFQKWKLSGEFGFVSVM